MTRTPSVDDLLEELNRLRIERSDATDQYRRTIARTDRREEEIVTAIERQRRDDNPAAQANLRNNRRNPLKVGEHVRITNNLRGEDGTIGIIITVGRRMVTIRDNQENEHSRAWWNLERCPEPRTAQ